MNVATSLSPSSPSIAPPSRLLLPARPPMTHTITTIIYATLLDEIKEGGMMGETPAATLMGEAPPHFENLHHLYDF